MREMGEGEKERGERRREKEREGKRRREKEREGERRRERESLCIPIHGHLKTY